MSKQFSYSTKNFFENDKGSCCVSTLKCFLYLGSITALSALAYGLNLILPPYVTVLVIYVYLTFTHLLKDFTVHCA